MISTTDFILGNKVCTLREDDGIAYSSETSHRWVNPEEEYISIWAITPLLF